MRELDPSEFELVAGGRYRSLRRYDSTEDMGEHSIDPELAEFLGDENTEQYPWEQQYTTLASFLGSPQYYGSFAFWVPPTSTFGAPNEDGIRELILTDGRWVVFGVDPYAPDYFQSAVYEGESPGSVDLETETWWNGPHDYEVRSVISTDPNDFQAVWQALLRYAAPGQTGISFTGNEVTIFGLPIAGKVVQTVDYNHFSIINTTMEGHFLYPGTVTRSVVVTDRGVEIISIGHGSGWLPNVNDFLAAPVWTFNDIFIYNQVHGIDNNNYFFFPSNSDGGSGSEHPGGGGGGGDPIDTIT